MAASSVPPNRSSSASPSTPERRIGALKPSQPLPSLTPSACSTTLPLRVRRPPLARMRPLASVISTACASGSPIAACTIGCRLSRLPESTPYSLAGAR